MKIKKSSFSFALILFFLAVPAFSQGWRGQGRLTGVVLDQDGRPLGGVKVKLFSLRGQSGFELVTDAKGEWKANYIRGGGWNLDFEKAGYAPKRITTNIQEVTNNPPLEIRLQKVEGLVITDELRKALNEGNKLYEENRLEEAIAIYENLLAQNPDLYILNKNIGNAYFKLEKYDVAEKYYQKILDQEPGNAEALLLIGNCYANRGQNEKAMEYYGRIEFEKISDPTVLFNLGSQFYSQSRLDEALKYYRRAVEIKKDFLDAIYQLGLTHIALGQYTEARETLENYLKLDSASGRANQVREFLEFLRKK